MLEFEQKHWSSGKQHIAGIDEAGRGPLAGPVVAAAVRAGAMLVVANAIVALVAYACRHCVSTNLNGI